MINSEYLYNSGAYKNLRIVLRIYTLFCRYANISKLSIIKSIVLVFGNFYRYSFFVVFFLNQIICITTVH